MDGPPWIVLRRDRTKLPVCFWHSSRVLGACAVGRTSRGPPFRTQRSSLMLDSVPSTAICIAPHAHQVVLPPRVAGKPADDGDRPLSRAMGITVIIALI